MTQIVDRMIGYSRQIVDREIVSCKKHRQACQRFLDDLDKQNKSSFPYQFNEEKAYKFFRWMKLFKHTKGHLANTFIEPHDIQVFVFGNIYGWEHKKTKLRRFRKGYWQVGRKNTKSQCLSMVASYELSALKEPSSEVYCVATKSEQAKIVWKEADKMIKNSDFLKDKFTTKYGRIIHKKSDSVFRPLSKDDHKSGDGLNPQCGIVDEYHAHKTSEYHDVLESGMGARKQPLMMIITTAGLELDNPCYRVEYNYCEKILDPNTDIDNDEYFIMINELEKNDEGELVDNIEDESCWIKANPIVADPSNEIGISYLRSRVKTAKGEEEKMREVLTKNFNVWVNMGEGKYMNMEKWNFTGTKKCPPMKNCSVTLGIDLSATIDLCSLGGIYLVDEKICVYSHSFMPEETLFRKMKTDRVPYHKWFKEGYISVTPGAEVDYRFIMKYIQELEEKNNLEISEVCFDKWNALQFSQEMEDEGFEMIEVRQGVTTLSEPTKKFRALTYDNKIYHDKNPVLNWALSNAVVRMDHNENIMLDKSKAIERIDPIASVINAFVRAVIFLDGSDYDSRPEGEKLFSI